MGKKRNFQREECSESESKYPRTVETDGIASTSRSNLESLFREMVTYLFSRIKEFKEEVKEEVKEELLESFKQFFQPSPRIPPNPIGTSEGRRWRLEFTGSLPHTLFTGNKIKADANAPLDIAIYDVSSKEIVTSGPLSNIDVEILVLEGDLSANSWSKEDFDRSVLPAREGKGLLVIGEPKRFVTLRNGVGHLGSITFMDNSKWTRSGKFKLGARADQNASYSETVREAISTTAVKVMDKRGEAYQKHETPNYYDEVWRLEKIGKGGKCCKELTSKGIKTVQDLLRLWVRDPSSLRIGCEIGKKTFDTIIEHANKCIIDPKQYVYVYRDVAPPVVLLMFDSIFRVIGAIFDGQNYVSRDNFSEHEKSRVEALKKLAYQNLEDIKEYNHDDPPVLPLDDATFPETGVEEVQQGPIQITNQDQPVLYSLNAKQILRHFLGDNCPLENIRTSSSNLASSSTACVQDISLEFSEIQEEDMSSILETLEEETGLVPTSYSATGVNLYKKKLCRIPAKNDKAKKEKKKAKGFGLLTSIFS